MRNPNQVLACPMNGKTCVEGVREDFPDSPQPGVKIKCRLWQHLVGKNPQGEGTVDEWDCSFAWLPITTIETSQMARQTAASVDKVSNEVAEVKGAVSTLARSVQVAGANIRQGIENGTIQLLVPPKSENGEKSGA